MQAPRTSSNWCRGLLTLTVLLAALTPGAGAATWVQLLPDGATIVDAAATPQAPQVSVPWYDATGLDVVLRLGGLQLEAEPAADGNGLLHITCPDSPLGGELGAPALPVVRRLFAAPLGATVDIDVRAGAPAIVHLRDLGFDGALPTVRGPASYDPAALPAASSMASAAMVDAFQPTELATITPVGVLRGRQLYSLEIRPVACNAARGVLAVFPDIRIGLRFGGEIGAGDRSMPASSLESGLLNPRRHASGAARASTNYLIITAQDFEGSDALLEFVRAKSDQGFSVFTYTAVPGTSRVAIQDYIRSLLGTENEADYVLLVGDALDLTALAGPYSIPIWTCTNSYSRTDLYYACLDGGDDWMPDVPIGRIPVRTIADLQIVVDKTLYVEAGDFADPTYTRRAAFMAGVDPYADAETWHNFIIDTYMTPNGITANKLYTQTYGATTADVSAAFNAGAFIGSYFGHAAGYQTWALPYFDFANIDALTNASLYPFLIGFSCSSAAFQYTVSTASPGYLEYWLTRPQKGCAAAFGTTTVLEPYAWSTWGNLYKFLFQALYTDGVRELGPACQAAANYAVAYYGPSDPAARNLMECFILLGDPSMQLPEAPSKNYLIISAPTYVNSTPLNQLIAARTQRGMNVTVHSVTAGTPRATIKTYIQSLWGTPDAPDYILLVGDTAGSTSTATTIPHWVGAASKSAPTDLPYACMDAGDDWYPDIAIGRFPVTTVAQLQAIVDKTLFVENGSFPDPDYVKRVAFLANPDTYNTAEPTAEWVISNYLEPNDYEPIRIYAAQGGDTQDVTAAVNNGCMFLTYMGHSSSSGWWDPGFDQGNVNALTNTGRYPLVFGWSCNTSNYPTAECFGETWVRAANKGAAAYISASTYIYWGSVEAWLPSAVLEKSFFTAFFDNDIWEVGPAWQDGLYRFLKDYGGQAVPGGPPTQHADETRNFFEEFVLFGDPALTIPQPYGFRLNSTPQTQSVCCPAASSAAYMLSTEAVGGFGETVTLTVEGAPAGATISFSANGAPPPFSSMLTVGNLTGLSPGKYNFLVRGTTATKQQTTPLELIVSNQVPGVPTLLSPLNGAVGASRTPTLTWQPATQAATYYVELSSNANFTQIVFAATVATASATVNFSLDAGSTFYWRTRAQNACGTSDLSTPFHFVTINQGDYFTEQFASGSGTFDLANKTVFFVPDGSGNYYHYCGAAATSLPTPPAGGTTLTLADDAYALITPAQPVKLYGVSYASCYVNANGNISFGQGDGNWTETLPIHFSMPRVAALYDDLNPATGGTVSWKQTADRVVATWLNVPEVSTSNSNTFQIELFFNGEIHITWLAIASADSIVGLSAGGGVPADFVETDLSAFGPCASPGACCSGESCTVAYENVCANGGGVFLGQNTDCAPNPCANYEPECLIISEIVYGALSGGCPRFLEITNTGLNDFAFLQGGIIVQSDDSSDVTVDVDLTGVTIPARQAFVVVSNHAGACTGAFPAIYGFAADFYTNVPFGDGNDRYILTDTADGSHLIDIYGQFGVNGTGQPWEYGYGYAHRLPAYNHGQGGTFVQGEWLLGGKNSLAGENPEQLLLTLTTPGTHDYDHACSTTLNWGDTNCDGSVNFADINPFVLMLTDPAIWQSTYPACPILNGDINTDGSVTFSDINPFVMLLAGS